MLKPLPKKRSPKLAAPLLQSWDPLQAIRDLFTGRLLSSRSGGHLSPRLQPTRVVFKDGVPTVIRAQRKP